MAGRCPTRLLDTRFPLHELPDVYFAGPTRPWNTLHADTQPLTFGPRGGLEMSVLLLVAMFAPLAGATVAASSGKLTAQIREGAPFDIFLSADVTYPETLFREALTTSEPLVYAYGKLILLTVKEGTEPSLKALESSRVKTPRAAKALRWATRYNVQKEARKDARMTVRYALRVGR